MGRMPSEAHGSSLPNRTTPVHRSLWAPWRLSYLRQLEDESAALRCEAGGNPSVSPGGDATSDGDFLREVWERPADDVANHVVHRDADGLILLNRYPYANGHLLVSLGRAAPRLLDYEPAERASFWRLVDRAVALCHAALRPQGLNIGINEGRAAGAGVPTHLHAHVVPRWGGDTNFMTVVGEVRVIPASLEAVATLYRSADPDHA